MYSAAGQTYIKKLSYWFGNESSPKSSQPITGRRECYRARASTKFAKRAQLVTIEIYPSAFVTISLSLSHSRMHTHPHAYTPTRTHTQTHTHAPTHTRTHTHTCPHTHIHTHAHTHTCPHTVAPHLHDSRCLRPHKKNQLNQFRQKNINNVFFGGKGCWWRTTKVFHRRMDPKQRITGEKETIKTEPGSEESPPPWWSNKGYLEKL